MEIKTKFDIGQKVFTFHGNNVTYVSDVKCFVIKDIAIGPHSDIRYFYEKPGHHTGDNYGIPEHEIIGTTTNEVITHIQKEFAKARKELNDREHKLINKVIEVIEKESAKECKK